MRNPLDSPPGVEVVIAPAPRMSTITTLLKDLLVGRNLAHLARETGINHLKIWRIAVGKQYADLRTGEAEKLHLALTGKPLIPAPKAGKGGAA